METKKNQIALVTGGSRGLGRDMALRLAEKGINVVITYNSRKEEALKVLAEINNRGAKAVALQLNVGLVKSFSDFIGALKEVLTTQFSSSHFDFLVNNGGFGIHNSVGETTEEQFDELMNVHFKGVYFLTQKCLPLLNDGGRIINISTGLARFAALGYSAY